MTRRTLVPESIHTTRLFLRPWRGEDAASLLPVLEANQMHLADWIPRRVAAPAPIPELTTRLDGFGADFASAREWRYAMFTADETMLLGEVALFPRNAAGRVLFAEANRVEIGYWLRSDMTGRGLATEATEAMLDVARTLPAAAHVEIRCDARNAASAAIPRRLGFVLASTAAHPSAAGTPPESLQIWTLALERVTPSEAARSATHVVST